MILTPHLRPLKQLPKQLHICELHFKKDDVLCVFSHVMKDGSLFHINRQQKKLKPNSIPCFFDVSDKIDCNYIM